MLARVTVALAIAMAVSGCAKAPGPSRPPTSARFRTRAGTASSSARNRARLGSALATASTQQEQARGNDVVGVLLIGLPVSSMSGDNIAPQIADLKGQQKAVQQTMSMKSCGAGLTTARAAQRPVRKSRGTRRMTSIIIADPVQNDQVVDLQSVFLIRESIPYEQRESPGAITCVYAGGADLLSSEPLASLLSKFSSLRLARLTAPRPAAALRKHGSCDRCRSADPLFHRSARARHSLFHGAAACRPRRRRRDRAGTSPDLAQCRRTHDTVRSLRSRLVRSALSFRAARHVTRPAPNSGNEHGFRIESGMNRQKTTRRPRFTPRSAICRRPREVSWSRGQSRMPGARPCTNIARSRSSRCTTLRAKRQADGDGWSTYRMLPFRYFFMRRSIGPGRFRN